jgi:hypothetical protein
MSPYYTKKQMCDHLGISERTLRRWDPLFEGAVLRGGHTVLYDLPVVIQLLKQRGSSFLGASPQRKQNKPKPPPQAKQNKPGKPPRKRTKHKKRKKK